MGGHVRRMEEIRNPYNISIRTSARKRPPRKTSH